ncbi:MAG: hypothetical protein IKU25_04240 [Clostridia bacterium]|nr:hypothetical protein [Clostridia bacterium]
MRKLLLIFLSVILTFSLCSCNDENSDNPETTTTTELIVAKSLTLGYYKDGDPKTITDYDLKQLLEYDEIHNLVLANYVGTDLSILTQFNGMKSLKLMSMENLTDLNFLTSLTELKSLTIYDLSDEFTDIGVLSKLDWLETLRINNICVEDFSPLYSLRKLRSLDLTSTAITQSQYDALVAALPECEIKNVTIYQ